MGVHGGRADVFGPRAGHTFWEKLGFTLVERRPFPYLQEFPDFVRSLEEQAKSVGIAPERAREQLVMRLNLI
jgi:hypothetical protein